MPDPTRRQVLALGLAAVAGTELLSACGSPASGPGKALEPFKPDSGPGRATGLAHRVAWAPTADSEFFLALGTGMRLAARQRGVEYLSATSGNDPGKHADQMRQLLKKGVGSLAMQPLDADLDTPVLKDAIARGVCAQGIITAPSTLQVAASQYAIGYDQGKAAADYVTAHLGGNAQVLYFNLDTVAPALRKRHAGVLAGLKTGGGGIEIVGDLTVADISTRSGFNTMTTALQAHPDIKVVLGGDTIVVGAYHALSQAGRLSDDMFLSGVDGDSEALKLIQQGGAYRLSIAFPWTLMGYGLGQFGADWIAGKKVPRLMVAKGVLLDSPNAVSRFDQSNADPAHVFADRATYTALLPLFGEVDHASHSLHWDTSVDPPKGST